MKTAKPTPLEMPGQHGLQRRSKVENSATRLCRLLRLTTNILPAQLLREAGDEIVRLREVVAAQPPASARKRR